MSATRCGSGRWWRRCWRWRCSGRCCGTEAPSRPDSLRGSGRYAHHREMREAMTTRCELAVAGGGLTGMTLAIACAGAGLEVTLVDRLAPEAMLKPGFDGRTTALPFGSRPGVQANG